MVLQSLQRRVLHVISGLSQGGAETMLIKLARQQRASEFPPAVATLEDGPMRVEIETLGIPVYVLPINKLRQPFALAALIRQLRPALIHSWLYRADLTSGLSLLPISQVKLIWSVRASDTLSPDLPLQTRALVRLNALLSHVMPDCIICCGDRPREIHEKFGYARRKMRVVPNGFDLEAFKPSAEARTALRNELGISATAPVIGMLARLHPMKDYPSLLQAIELLDDPRVHFVLAGTDVMPATPLFRSALAASKHKSRIHLLGARSDPARVWAACDIGTLSSSSEGFPNSLGEAMCCGVPCVATDVGETAAIIGDTGRVVPPRNPAGLADGWRQLLALEIAERQALGQCARQRMADRYGIASVAKQFKAVYREILGDAEREGGQGMPHK